MESFDLTDYLNVLRRRIRLFAAVTCAVFVLGCLFALSWSNYRSEATIEIAQPEILTSYTDTDKRQSSSLESLVDLHISRLQQKVLSTGSLVEIITKFNLYDDERRSTPMAALADKMRKKIAVKLVGSSLANPASAQKASADQLSAIAFVLSFECDNPSMAQRVTNELVSRFLDEDARQRRSKAQETTAFLDSQLKALEESLAEQEKKIAAFREANGDVRPEALSFNQQAMVSTQMGLQNLETQIAANLGSQGALRAQLAATDPYSRMVEGGRLLTTPSAQLKALKSEQAALTARYGAAHPDVQKINRQVAALEAQAGDVNLTAGLESRIADTKARLAAARSRYGAQNPDVLALEKQLHGLQSQLAVEHTKGAQNADGFVADADNPAYLQIVAQLRAAIQQGRALTAQREDMNRQLAKYKSAVVQNPAAEQQLAALSRDYDNAQVRYRELRAGKLAAEMNATIQQDRSGQRLVVINPPEMPLGTSPPRLLFFAASFVFALGAGLVSVLGLQLLSESVIGPRHVAQLTGAPPFVVIPHIGTQEEQEKIFRQRKRLVIGGVIGGVLLMIVFSYVVMPLDVLGAVLMRRLGL